VFQLIVALIEDVVPVNLNVKVLKPVFLLYLFDLAPEEQAFIVKIKHHGHLHDNVPK
jgi:hypothetical protein